MDKVTLDNVVDNELLPPLIFPHLTLTDNQGITQAVAEWYSHQEKKKAQTYSSYALPHPYRERWKMEREDLLKFIQPVTVRNFPVSGNEGLYGWTIPGSGIIHQRDDLKLLGHALWDKQTENKVHEGKHHPAPIPDDEYATRQITRWVMESMFPGQKGKYSHLPQNYRQ